MRNFVIPQDQMQRFNGTIVRFDGAPVYINVAGDKWHLYKPSSISTKNPIVLMKGVDPYDARVDISSLPMGYVNIEKDTSVRYVSRRPVKKFQQGISAEVLSVEALPEGNHPNRDFYHPQDILRLQSFEDTVMGVFPNLDDSIEALQKWGANQGYGEIAIDRHIALSVDKLGIIKAYYRNSLVGWMAPGKKVLNVPNSSMGWVVSHHMQGLGWEIN